MDTFYIIVLSIAACTLIILLTFIGIKMTYNRRQSQGTTFPPSYSNCPDNWTADTEGNCTVGNFNTGNSKFNKKNTPGYISSKQINFQDESWGSTSTRVCTLNNWAKINNISWDGISNYNNCK